MSLNVSAIFPERPVHEPGSRTEKSPLRMVCRAARTMLKSAGDSATAAAAPFPPFPCACVSMGSMVATELWALFFIDSFLWKLLGRQNRADSGPGGPDKAPQDEVKT